MPRASTGRSAASPLRTTGSELNANPAHGEAMRTSTPSTTPLPIPSSISRRVIARARMMSLAPSSLPIMACPAIASASSTNARVAKIVKAICTVASSGTPIPVAITMVASMAARNDAVRSSNQAPACPANNIPLRCGRRLVPSRRAKVTSIAR